MPKPKRYTAIEFDVHQALHWDRDNIILALNVIRKKFCEPQDLARHGLSAHIMARELPNSPGELYPVIGLVIPTTKYFGHFSTDSITSLFQAWLRSHQVTDLLNEASKIGVPNWEQLLSQETYPVDPRTLYL